MADLNKRVATNVSGEFFVDTTCINCDTCRQLAPQVFEDAGEFSSVYAQPQTKTDIRHATQALLACPTGSIGTVHANQAKQVMSDFPMPLPLLAAKGVPEIYYCGFNSPKSYGGNSYLIRHAEGNWLIDSPKFLPHLVNRLEVMGGLRFVFLTHRDDVADADRYAKHFGAQRIIHRAEREAQPEAEIFLEGEDPVPFGEDFLVIPTPGHTEGHCVLLYKKTFLFTGDHLSAGYDGSDRLRASKTYNWYSWPQQVESLRKLTAYPFEWVLPGHGRRLHKNAADMRQALEALLIAVSS